MNALLSEMFLFWFTAACKLWQVSYGPKYTWQSLSNTLFCVYFEYNSKTMQCLQLYYTPNDSSTTEDALFHVKRSKAVPTYKLLPHTNVAVCYFVRKYEWQQNSGSLWLYYNTVTTAFLPRLHILEIQTEAQLTSCSPAAIAYSVLALHVGYIN